MIAFELFISPRWWCVTMCPGGALYGLLGYFRLLRVKLKQSRCTECGICRPLCEVSIDPVVESDGIECTNCGVCIRHCPEKALRYSVGLSSRHARDIKKYSLSTALVLFLTSVTLFAGLPSSAEGHHILGLPHYSYKENYPQVPTLEYPAIVGPYDILLTSYPGKPVPDETASLSIYMKHSTTGIPFDKPITVRVVQTFTFGRSREIFKPTVSEPIEQPHKMAVTFPEDGEYIVEVTMVVEGKTEVIPFVMVAGEPSATLSVIVAIIAGLILFIIVVRAIKIKRDRRMKNNSAVTTPITIKN
jgi:ferredoxin